MDDNKYLKINIKALEALGLWEIKSKNLFIKILHKIFSYFLLLYFGTFIITEYIEIIKTLNRDFFDVLNNLSVSLLYSVTIIKIKICKSDRIQKFAKLISNIEEAILGEDDDEMKEIYWKHVNWNHRLNKIFITLTTVTSLGFFVNPSISEWTEPILNYTEIVDGVVVFVDRPLPFSSWFPFDRYKYYDASFAIQVFAGILGSAFTCNLDIYYWGFMIFGIGQLKILQYKLRNLRRDGLEFARHNNISSDDAVHLMLKKSIILHKTIINYINDLNHCTNFLMLLDFGICSMQIGVIGFQVVVSGFGWKQVFAGEYLLAMLVQMFLFYWHANEIILESLKVAVAVWEGDFYEYAPRTQKSLMFMMMRAEKPLTLNIGPFYAMSTTTAISIVRAAYSYVALMRQVYN